MVIPLKRFLTLGSATVSASGTCGGSISSIFMVYAIFNIEFLVESTASNEIPVVEGGALNNVMISFTACIKKSNLNYVKGYSWGIKLTVSQLRTWFIVGKITL